MNTKEIIDRFSIFDLRELTPEQLERGDEQLSGSTVEITDKGVSSNFISWWIVKSEERIYHVRRFENFCFCSCPDFNYKRTGCKHIAATMPTACPRCRKAATTRGILCLGCEAKSAVYLKYEAPSEKMDGFRI
jgi:hypothetical protein